MVFRPRWTRLRWVSLFLVLNLAVVYLAFVLLYRDYRRRLEEELGLRLIAVATATAAAVDPGTWNRAAGGDSAAAASLRERLGGLRSENGVADIFFFDPDERIVLDLGERFAPGEVNPALAFDVAPVTSALAGLPAASRLYSDLGVYLKSAYAPVMGADGEVVGGVGVEGSATFFQVLEQIRRTLIVAAALVLAGILVLGGTFARLIAVREGLETRLRRSETLATMGEMTAMLAHEIRNPLGIIRGAAERLGERHGLGEDELFRFIPEEVDRLERTLGTYLDFARPREGGGPGDAREALLRTLEIVERELEGKGIALEREIDPEGAPVRGEAERLQQAFLNLILNARDAMPRGGTLRVRLARRGRRVEITFADSGEGMSEEVRRRAVEPFFTAKERGSGLGLAVVRRVVEEMSGKLEIGSAPGRGTTVTLSLPLRGTRG